MATAAALGVLVQMSQASKSGVLSVSVCWVDMQYGQSCSRCSGSKGLTGDQVGWEGKMLNTCCLLSANALRTVKSCLSLGFNNFEA